MIGTSIVILISLLTLNACKPTEPSISDLDSISVEYAPTDAKFANPERGFYKFTRIDLTTGSGALSQSQLESFRQKNITLIMRMFYLKKFRNTPLNQAALDELEKDFVTARNAGVKLIIRFAYSEQPEEPDAPLDIVLQHMDQMKAVIHKNADVIATVQAGFIGAWGEWYYTSNKLNTAGARKSIIEKLLEMTPPNRTIQLRTPEYKQQFLQRNTPMSFEEAFKGTDIARIGHHNDCFMASSTDYGTYRNPETDKSYLNRECLFVPIGGETCPPEGVSPADATKAQSEMRYLRWSYLNEDYYRPVNDSWIAQGGMDNILREMGYRLELKSAEYTNKVKPGGVFNARIIIKNLGYAPLYNERYVELILRNREDGTKYRLRADDIEPRFWQPLVENAMEFSVGMPADIPEGNYELLLNLPDPAPAIYDKPAFSVRIANDLVWETATGYNNLLVDINVAEANKSPEYSGSKYFEIMN